MSIDLELGIVKGELSGVKDMVADMKEQNKTMEKKLDKVVTHIEQSKGGWKVITLLAAVSGTLGAGVAKLITWLSHIN